MRGLKSYYKSADDVVEFQRAYPDIQYRYLVVPTEKYATKSLDFRAASTTKSWNMGTRDGAKFVAKGEGYMFQRLREWRDSKELT